MENQDDNNNQEIEKVEDVEVETNQNISDAGHSNNEKQNDDDGYEKVCFLCRRPESVAGKMIELPNQQDKCALFMIRPYSAAVRSGSFRYRTGRNTP